MSDKDTIYRQDAIDAINAYLGLSAVSRTIQNMTSIQEILENLPSAEPEIIRCKNCKYWKQQTNYIGVPLPFGFCENDNMWGLLYGETCEVSHIDTDDDFYCGYAERRGEQE